ncbi:MAG: phosphodiester glycosidase family protein [Acidobacteriota bacterium]
MKRNLSTRVSLLAIALLVAGFDPARHQCTGYQFQVVASGIEHLRIARGYKSENAATGPWQINLLRIDLSRVEVKLVHALDEGVGLETTSSMAARYAADAAINAGFFKVAGTYRGDPAGAFVAEGKLMSEPANNRAAVGFIRGATTEIIFGHLTFTGLLKTSRGGQRTVDGINRQRAADEMIIYTPEFHRTTLTTPDGIEVVVRRNRVVKRRDRRGSSRVPDDGYVISAAGKAGEWARKHLTLGARVQLVAKIEPVDKNQRSAWRRAVYIVGGGPQLIRNGRIDITSDREGINQKFVTDLHPRTAIASLGAGRILLVAVDGRQPDLSAGMSLEEIARLLLEFGARDAINLDGGGSTTMVVAGKIVNSPSDQTGERAVSDAILFFSKANGAKP